MHTTSHGAKGFTLLELMIVVAVFGILTAVSVPTISGHLRTARVAGAAGTLAADLRYARALASAQRRTFAVTFATRTYAIARLSPPEVVLRRELPRGVAFGAPDTATFFAWGLTEPATITVADAGRTRVVRLLANGSVSHD